MRNVLDRLLVAILSPTARQDLAPVEVVDILKNDLDQHPGGVADQNVGENCTIGSGEKSLEKLCREGVDLFVEERSHKVGCSLAHYEWSLWDGECGQILGWVQWVWDWFGLNYDV